MSRISWKLRKVGKWMAESILLLAALACIFTWADIKPPWSIHSPGAPAMTPSAISAPTVHSYGWLVTGLFLFAVGLASSGYSFYRSWKAGIRSSKPKLDGEIYRIVRGQKDANMEITRQFWESVKPGKPFETDTDILVEIVCGEYLFGDAVCSRCLWECRDRRRQSAIGERKGFQRL